MIPIDQDQLFGTGVIAELSIRKCNANAQKNHSRIAMYTEFDQVTSRSSSHLRYKKNFNHEMIKVR